MADGILRASVDLSDAERGLSNLRNAGVNLRPAFAQMRKPFRDDQRAHAKAAEGPETSWPARAASTRKRMGGGRRKKLLGRLPAAVSVKVESRAIWVVSKVKWSDVHQTGGTVGHGARIPARPFLWVSDQMQDTAIAIVAKHLTGAF